MSRRPKLNVFRTTLKKCFQTKDVHLYSLSSEKSNRGYSACLELDLKGKIDSRRKRLSNHYRGLYIAIYSDFHAGADAVKKPIDYPFCHCPLPGSNELHCIPRSQQFISVRFPSGLKSCKCVKRLQSQKKSKVFDLFHLTFIISVLSGCKLPCNTNSVYMGASH